MKELMIIYALSFVGRPYIWGGQNPLKGFDCSGFVQEVLASIGLDPRGDQTAQTLYHHFLQIGYGSSCSRGALLFFGKSEDKITHIALALSDKIMLEAGGGGSKTVNADIAAKQGAFVRVRPIKSRSDLIAAIMPLYQ